MDRADHRSALLLHGRCDRCAERVPRYAIVRGTECEHCGRVLGVAEADVRGDLETYRRRWRLIGYGLVAAASFLAGLVPLLQFPIQLAALFILHVVVLRRGLNWLPAGRRILARVTIKLLGAAIACMALVINVVVAPMLSAGAAILAVVGPGLTVAYVEGGLAILRKRLAWEDEGRTVDMREWWLPVGLLVGLFVLVGGVGVATAWLVQWLQSLEVPAVPETMTWLLEMLP